ncbi:carbohydrate kinase family protein [Yeosuana sp. AK3]
MARITCFGEVLWDVFPTHEKIGGAPLNVALRLNSFNHEVYMISAIGKDKRGDALINCITESGLSKAYIQMNETLETGAVQVSLNDKGSASYTIEFPRAWDAIELNDDLKALVSSSDAFVFGSLVARDNISKNTLFELIEASQYSIFDLNLRPPHYTKEFLIHLMNKADFIKFNDDELYEVSGYLGSKYLSMEQNIRFISEVTNTKHICVTKGNHGAVLWYHNAFYYNSGYLIKVKDTVGAGDSFLASLISQLLNKVNPQDAINFACAVGAMVAQSEGANPKITLKEIESFMNPES